VEDSEAEGGQGLQSSAHRERFLWRIDQFVRLGFNEAEASDLADSDADLGQARHLLATGCSSTLALQILL
jgi:protein involved in temperature-dependent protein secretion